MSVITVLCAKSFMITWKLDQVLSSIECPNVKNRSFTGDLRNSDSLYAQWGLDLTRFASGSLLL